jgi:hypothetical protein
MHLKRDLPTPKATIAPPPIQFLERALGDRPDPCNTKAACARDFGDWRTWDRGDLDRLGNRPQA